MIVEIGSTLPSFRTQRFHPGLNVLLADRTRSSAETGSRNGAGKSSLVEIVHFLLGGRVGKGSVLRADALRYVTFHGVFTFGGHSVTARRKPSDPSKVRIETRHPDAAFIGWESDDDGPFVELDAWCEWLGKSAFGLPMPKPPSLPSFRAMFGFFARRREDGGFLLPSTYEPQIPRGKTNFALAYLLDLDVELVRQFEVLRKEKSDFDAARRKAALLEGAPKETAAKLRSASVLADERAREAALAVSAFRVLDHYEEVAADAMAKKLELERLSTQAAEIDTTLEHLERAIADEGIGDERDLVTLFQTAGVQLPGTVVKTFEEVRSFHRSVVANRRKYLEAQIDEARDMQKTLRLDIERLSGERSSLLTLLEATGAFTDLVGLQRRLAKEEARAERLRARLEEAESDSRASSRFALRRETLRDRLETDLLARTRQVDAAVLEVGRTLRKLYGNREGGLEVSAVKSGLDVKVTLEGDRSGGISNMEIFAFDLALFRLVSERLGGPGFLIHDSHLFDGVDLRQVALALERGSDAADDLRKQYIVTMNSDIFASLPFAPEFGFEDSVLPKKLDDTEFGGLFGMKVD